MAPRKKPNVPKPAKTRTPIDPIEAEAKKLMAQLKRHKADISSENATIARFTRKYELKKEELELKIASTDLNAKEKEKKHLKKMEKLREETRKVDEHLREMQVQAASAERDLKRKLTKEQKTLINNREKCAPVLRRHLAEAVAANGGEKFAWQLCEICIEPYDNVRHAPRTLACGHTICMECYNNLLREYWRVVCPFDRSYVGNNQPHQGSRLNIALVELCE